MGSICNGIALSGIRPTARLPDLQRLHEAAIRLAAIMELPVITSSPMTASASARTGPTHQPIEQLMALRAIPGMVVIRPGDANEVAEAWRVAMQSHDRPVALILSRQVPADAGPRQNTPMRRARPRAYVIADARGCRRSS